MAKPIESFGPELLALLLRGGLERVELVCPSYNFAVRLQQRINSLRAEMRRALHPQYSIAARVKVAILWGPRAAEQTQRNKDVDFGLPEEIANKRNARRPREGEGYKTLLVLEPHDIQFRSVINAAGITVDDKPNVLLDEADPKGSEFDHLIGEAK